jgi:tRNA threonylcarbamoyladenosine biosynthesis protein TsaE
MSSPHHTQLTLDDEAATLDLGAALAKILAPGLIIHLCGDLGAGKTTLSRGILRALGHTGPVKSPTYTLVELYVISGYSVYHFDFYRFNSPEEWHDAGLDEYFDGAAICLIEWPEKAGEYPPSPDIEITLLASGEARQVSIRGKSERGTSCLSDLRIPPSATRRNSVT